MVKKKLGHIELEWTCPACGTRNAGTRTTCRSCGGAMPDDVDFELPPGGELDTSQETAKKVAAGPDINCPYCGTRNPATATQCSQCGGALSAGDRRKTGKVLGAYKTGAVPDLKCPHCGAMNPGTAKTCKSCGGALTIEKKPAAKATGRVASSGVSGGPTYKPKKGIFAIFFIVFALMVVGGILLTRGCSESLATVSDVGWTYTIEIDGLVPVSGEAWRDEIPAGAEVVRCERRVRSIEQEPVPGAVEVCGTPYVVDTGTGQGQVVQDCEYHVSDNWCEYLVLQWQTGVRKEVAQGQDFSPGWPAVYLSGTSERQGARSEVYRVVFLADDKEYTYRPRTLAEFRRFEIGSKWTIETNALGGVTSVTAPQ